MKIQTKKLTDLKPAGYNPRTISEQAMAGLKASISEFGCVQPIIWNKSTDNVVGGHQRLEALKQQGVKETDVVVVDLSEEKEKALNIALNSRHISGEFTMQLEGLLEEIKVDDPNLYCNLNMELLLDDLPVTEAGEPEKKDPTKDPEDNDWVEFVIGDIKGKIPRVLYDMYRSEHDRMGGLRETDKIPPIFEAIIVNSSSTPLESLA